MARKIVKKRVRGGASVPCPACGAPSRVRETRREGLLVRRLRRCLSRNRHEFFTLETRQP
jgi:hypothetical protein